MEIRMISILNHFFNKFVRLIVALKSSYILLNNRILHDSNNSKIVFLDLTEGKYWYSYFYILYSFLDSGFTVRLKLNFKSLAGFNNHVLVLLKNKKLQCELPFHNSIYELKISDKKTFDKESSDYIFLRYNYFNKNISSGNRLPYLMHPNQYISESKKCYLDLRSNKKTIAIFYSGNTHQLFYDNQNIPKFFNIKTRFDLINTVESCLAEDKILKINESFPLNKITSDSCFINKFVMIKWTWTPKQSENLNSRISEINWLETLSMSRFFLCCPGIKIPFSHNTIEAMSVGCVPILQYAELFDPPLVDGINCILFDNNNFIEKLNYALSISNYDYEALSLNVKSYFDTYLKPSSIVQQFYNLKYSNSKEILILDEVDYS